MVFDIEKWKRDLADTTNKMVNDRDEMIEEYEGLMKHREQLSELLNDLSLVWSRVDNDLINGLVTYSTKLPFYRSYCLLDKYSDDGLEECFAIYSLEINNSNGLLLSSDGSVSVVYESDGDEVLIQVSCPKDCVDDCLITSLGFDD